MEGGEQSQTNWGTEYRARRTGTENRVRHEGKRTESNILEADNRIRQDAGEGGEVRQTGGLTNWGAENIVRQTGLAYVEQSRKKCKQ